MLGDKWMLELGGSYAFIVFCVAMVLGGNCVDDSTSFEGAGQLSLKPAFWWTLAIGLAIGLLVSLLIWRFLDNPIAPQAQAQKPTKLVTPRLRQPPPSLPRPTVGGDSRPATGVQDANKR